MRIGEWLALARQQLPEVENAKREMEILLGKVLKKPRSWIMAFDDQALSSEQSQQLTALLERRRHGEPIAYLLGEREFWSLPLQVNSHTLIPRPDTEILVETGLKLLPKQACQILDLGSGSGAVALALAVERPDCRVTGVDRVGEAVALARSNSERLAITNGQFLLSHWFEQLPPQKYQLIVTNPPYIDAEDPHLAVGDVRFEPLSALVADEQGLADLRVIIDKARQWLTEDGWLATEHGWQQAEAVRELFLKAGYQQVATEQDYGGNPRVTYGQYRSSKDENSVGFNGQQHTEDKL